MTAPRGVHFAMPDSPGFPSLDNGLDDASLATIEDSSGAMAFINAQLLAHGFTHGSGIVTDGMPSETIVKLSKCLLNMLGQRTGDMKRAEDLTTKFRTLSYDYENLTSRHKDAVEKSAHSEREMNVYKSRLATAQRTLQTTSLAHKHTTVELTRIRTSVQGLRSTHLSELRKRDKEVERMVERWSKVSDAQLKVSSTGAGMILKGAKCANAMASDGSGILLLGGCKGYLDIALEEAERSRAALAEENNMLRRLFLRAVNDGQEVAHQLRIAADPDLDLEAPSPMTLSTLFPLAPNDVASEKLASLFGAFQASVAVFADPFRASSSRSITPAQPSEQPKPAKMDTTELNDLRRQITTITRELSHSKKHASEQAAQMQVLVDQLAAREHAAQTGIPEISIELIRGPDHDEAQARLEASQAQLAEERARLTESAVKLGHDRARLEQERIAFLEEKRSWQVTQMLQELPPTPAVAEPEPLASSPRRHRRARGHASPRKARSRSPVKIAQLPHVRSPVKALSPAKKKRGARRSSLLASIGGLNISPQKRGVAAPSFETEVMLPPLPSAYPVAGPSTGVGTIAESKGPLLASSFVLPPPSPMAKIPSRAVPAAAPAPVRPPKQLTFPPIEPVAAAPPVVAAPRSIVPVAPPAASSSNTLAVPQTPGARPFASRAIAHAYSPAKPSPLSRILMLANSPPSPPALSTLAETDEEDMSSGPEVSPTPAPPVFTQPRGKPQPSLAAELELADLDMDADPVLREKPKNAESRRAAGQEKERGRAVQPTRPPSRVQSSKAGATEKENVAKRTTMKAGATSAPTTRTSKPPSSAKPPQRAAAGLVGAPKVAPRRVVVDRSSAPVKRPFA